MFHADRRRFEDDLQFLRLTQSRNAPLPKFVLQERSVEVLRQNVDLGATDLELSIIRGLDIPITKFPESALALCVAYEIPLPSAETPKTGRTPVIRKTANPAFNFIQRLEVNPSRLARQIQRRAIRFTLLHEVKSLFTTKTETLGTAELPLADLGNHCTVSQCLDLRNERGLEIGAQLEVQLRLRRALVHDERKIISHRWLLLETGSGTTLGAASAAKPLKPVASSTPAATAPASVADSYKQSGPAGATAPSTATTSGRPAATASSRKAVSGSAAAGPVAEPSGPNDARFDPNDIRLINSSKLLIEELESLQQRQKLLVEKGQVVPPALTVRIGMVSARFNALQRMVESGKMTPAMYLDGIRKQIDVDKAIAQKCLQFRREDWAAVLLKRVKGMEEEVTEMMEAMRKGEFT